jgi:hypothetical protein
VRETRGEAQFQELMAFLRQPFPYKPIRHGEPLLRALDPYLSRRVGPFAMHALSEYVGRDPVHGAIRRLIARHDSAGAPTATSLDLYRELQSVTPDSLRYLLHDLFEVSTDWRLETERATAEETGDGWRVTLDVRAEKAVYDSAGGRTEAPMDEWIPIGIFGAAERGAAELSAPLYLRNHRIRSGEQTIVVSVSRRPVLVGIDPHHLLDWEEGEDDDNIGRVEVDEAR